MSQTSVDLVGVFESLPRFTSVVAALQPRGDDSRWFLVEQRGRVLSFENRQDVSSTTAVLDIAGRVNSGPNEAGLLGMAFDPDFETTGVAYLSYTTFGGPVDLTSRISRFVSRDGGRTFDAGSEEILLELEQPYVNHNGGNIAFGHDGYLYAAFGDGGHGGDPGDRAQNLDVFFGKVLRIDVSASGPYAIPASNPFVDGGGRPEIFAYGFRNPWRWSFDRDTGDLWLGDVGQGRREEINRIEKGGNYGWRHREGSLCFQPRTNCTTSGLIDPVVDYGRDLGSVVVGGYVYRGQAIPQLVGTYVYGDYVSGNIWAIDGDRNTGAPTSRLLATGRTSAASFAEDQSGELYWIHRPWGRFYKLVPSVNAADAAPEPPSSFPHRLSQTGCVDGADPSRFAAGVIPFDVNSSLWADGATKTRGIALPDGARIDVGADGDWELPIGTVLLKTFTAGDRKLETRLLVRHDDGDWAGYAYLWNDEQTDATLLQSSTRIELSGGDWRVPSRAECLACHTEVAGRTLGLETAQMNRDFVYPNGAVVNQLEQFQKINLFSSPLGVLPRHLPAYPDPSLDGPPEPRARSYLHANCSMCHRPSGAAGDVDLRFTTPLPDRGLCNVVPRAGDLGARDALLVWPGEPDRSVLSLRMHALDANRMPPIASRLVDAVGTGAIDAWIESLEGCP